MWNCKIANRIKINFKNIYLLTCVIINIFIKIEIVDNFENYESLNEIYYNTNYEISSLLFDLRNQTILKEIILIFIKKLL